LIVCQRLCYKSKLFLISVIWVLSKELHTMVIKLFVVSSLINCVSKSFSEFQCFII
jgi:hypothetical protein